LVLLFDSPDLCVAKNMYKNNFSMENKIYHH
jgi:hypothetical protein